MTAPRQPRASMRQARGQDQPPGAIPVKGYSDLLEELPPARVIAALQAALSFHEPRADQVPGELECQCRGKGGQRYLWPCPEVRHIIAVLGGEG